MVKFVGGPSVGGYKSYINHTTAREGQWRMPRNYGRPNVNIKVRNYNTCCHQSSVNTGFQLPAWLQWFQFGANLLQSFIPAPKQETPEAPATNSNDQTLKDLQKQIDDLKKENEALKKKPAPVETPETAEEAEKPATSFDVEVSAEEVKDKKTEEITLTTEAPANITKKNSDGTVNFQGWNTLAKSYGVENTLEFRNWFRTEHLKNKEAAIWGAIENQNFPTTITYNNKTYTFNAETFKNPIDTNDPTKNKKIETANMDQQTDTIETTTTTYKGRATATWTDKDGKSHTVTHNTTQTDFKDKDTAKRTALNAIKTQVPEEYRSSAKFKAGAGES